MSDQEEEEAHHLLHQQYERPEQQRAEGGSMQQDVSEIIKRRNLGGNIVRDWIARSHTEGDQAQ
jgi:hypothetical protein